MNSGGPNITVLHLRSTSEPWTIANEEDNLTRNLKLIFDMDAREFYRSGNRENECQPLLKKQPLPLPRRYLSSRSSIACDLSNQQNRSKTNDYSQSIIEPPRRFCNEYERGMENTKFPVRRKIEKQTPRSISYYPILSPPPGFQDSEIKSMENCENINPAANTNMNCDCLSSSAESPLPLPPPPRSKADPLSTQNVADYYRDKTYRGLYSSYVTPGQNDKVAFNKTSHCRTPVSSDYCEYDEFGNRFRSASFNDHKGAFSSWRSESDPYSECSQLSYKCYCNHCRVGSVPSTLSHNIVSDSCYPFYPDVFDEREYLIDVPAAINSFNSTYETETPQPQPQPQQHRQKIRRAASFQTRCASVNHATDNNSVEYYPSARFTQASRSQSRARYASFDDAFYESRPTSNIARYSRSANTHHFSNYCYNNNSNKTRYEYQNRLQDCSCTRNYEHIDCNNVADEPRGRNTRTSSISIPIQTKSRRYEEIYPITANTQNHQLYEEIYPASKEKSSQEIINPPDIANISSYSRFENHNAYDPEFIRKQPDILQSSYYGNRSASSLSTHPTAASCHPGTTFPTQPNASIDEMKRKSYSLPKSFQRHDKSRSEFKSSDNPALIFHWRKHGVRGLLLNKKVIVPPSVMSETAPTTPIRDMPEKKKYGRLMKVGQYSSTPSLDDNSVKHINFDCDNRYKRDRFKSSKTATINSADFRPTSQENIVSNSNLGDRVFHKFCKSFSLRFLRKPSDAEEGDKNAPIRNIPNKVFCEPAAPTKKHFNRFGPLAWRSSKERKNKAIGWCDRNNEGDVPNRVENNSKDKDCDSKGNHQQRIIRRTLSDLNEYSHLVKDKDFNLPTKYRPATAVVSKKHRQYNLRRTASQPLFSSRFSPALERKPSICRAACSEDERALFSEDDMMSDSGSSIPSRKNSLEQGINEEVVIYAEAVWDHVAIESEELPFNAGDVIEVYNVLDREWWWGMCNGKSGWFPSDFVRLRVNQEETLENHLDSPSKLHASLSVYSNDQVRSKIVCELINTERDFVKVLKDVKEAFIIECRNATQLFSAEDVYKIFGNWEQILAFQILLLENLDSSLDSQAPHKTCVGDSFIKFQEHFRMYSDYCNNHPLSIATLQQFYQKAEYRNFFEKCRIKKSLIEIPLDGFLLTPIQRICKYPLQLAELLKYTEDEHADYDAVRNALNAMRQVAVLINERKRRMESLEKLILWQQRIEGWEGDNLIENSSQLIHQNDVTKVFAGVWSTNVTLFLFDHQLVFCKKDILKRDFYMYKGRISLDSCHVIDVPDGKDSLLGINIRHGIKIQNVQKNKWLLFSCRTHKEKSEWLEAFKREKELVLLDERNKLQITPVDRHLAYITATTCSSRHTFLKHKNKKLKRSFHSNSHFSRNTGSPHILGRKVGTWFMFGANRKNHRRINTKNQITAV